MLKISANWEYSLIIVKFLINNKDKSYKIKDLAELTMIPESILRKIINRLEKSAIVESKLWRGWWIKIKKDEISVYEVLEISGEDLNIATCSSKICNKKEICEIGWIVKNLQKWFDTILKITKV
ncbi:MAG: hypothetical protein ACD_4C00263G0001 [uncultured bacterium (gcode 4)]|uniref:Transcriptional regulator, BadM/Rrf2 family n=1 Tax=uncultured bacterium (gcode 4) TaxID=1234023 RepID=K2G8N7_9BACT|nr:MAG: hypothetical protein ACD_4C00263G0001 [uncultured bacterium (gcode 4)]